MTRSKSGFDERTSAARASQSWSSRSSQRRTRVGGVPGRPGSRCCSRSTQGVMLMPISRRSPAASAQTNSARRPVRRSGAGENASTVVQRVPSRAS